MSVDSIKREDILVKKHKYIIENKYLQKRMRKDERIALLLEHNANLILFLESKNLVEEFCKFEKLIWEADLNRTKKIFKDSLTKSNH